MNITSSLAVQTYTHARPATAPQPESTGLGGFTGLVSDFADTLKAGEEAAKATMTGGADAQSLVEALAASQVAVETAVTLRDKVVEAYQEILRMQV